MTDQALSISSAGDLASQRVLPALTADEAEPSANAVAVNRETLVFRPPAETTVGSQRSANAVPVQEDAELEPTVDDVRAHFASLTKRSSALNNRPLELNRNREEEKKKEEKKRLEQWPTTTLRIRFSDQTQIQHQFPSTSKMRSVYDFIRASLTEEVRSKKFSLYEPPNQIVPEIPIPPPVKKNRPYGAPTPPPPPETLFELHLVPQAVLIVRFEDSELNRSDRPAPLLASLLSQATPLPPPKSNEPAPSTQSPTPGQASSQGDKGKQPETKLPEKKLPKWLQKGLKKK